MFPLDKSARIGVVAPSGAVDAEKFAVGMAWMRDAGWCVTADAKVTASLGYLAGGEEERKASLIRMADTRPSMLIAARGGYGAMRLLAHLSVEELNRLPVLMGFSDTTALLVRLVGLGHSAIHGPTVQSLASASEETLGALDALLAQGVWPDPLRGDGEPLVEGWGQGRLTGGNITTLAHLCGTPFQPDFSGCVLALEEVNEVPYRMDRALTQMRLSGLFTDVAGVMVGECLHCGSPDAQARLFREFFQPLGIPVMSGGRFGHGSTNLPLQFGVEVTLSSDMGFAYV